MTYLSGESFLLPHVAGYLAGKSFLFPHVGCYLAIFLGRQLTYFSGESFLFPHVGRYLAIFLGRQLTYLAIFLVEQGIRHIRLTRCFYLQCRALRPRLWR